MNIRYPSATAALVSAYLASAARSCLTTSMARTVSSCVAARVGESSRCFLAASDIGPLIAASAAPMMRDESGCACWANTGLETKALSSKNKIDTLFMLQSSEIPRTVELLHAKHAKHAKSRGKREA